MSVCDMCGELHSSVDCKHRRVFSRLLNTADQDPSLPRAYALDEIPDDLLGGMAHASMDPRHEELNERIAD